MQNKFILILKTMLCVAFASAERTYTGAQGGEIYEWNGNTLNKAIKAHAVRNLRCQSLILHRGQSSLSIPLKEEIS